MPNQISVPFHGTNLLLVEHQNQPYVPMKQIVEGMGLIWRSQHKKLIANKERWGVTVKVIPSIDAHNEVTCLPLRKLFGWLNSLHPNRVREDIRKKVIQYQNECDDVLYQYWTEHSEPQNTQEEKCTGLTRVLMVFKDGKLVDSVPVDRHAGIVSFESPETLQEMIRDTLPGYVLVQRKKLIDVIG